jgi:hypothetical protein
MSFPASKFKLMLDVTLFKFSSSPVTHRLTVAYTFSSQCLLADHHQLVDPHFQRFDSVTQIRFPPVLWLQVWHPISRDWPLHCAAVCEALLDWVTKELEQIPHQTDEDLPPIKSRQAQGLNTC